MIWTSLTVSVSSIPKGPGESPKSLPYSKLTYVIACAITRVAKFSENSTAGLTRRNSSHRCETTSRLFRTHGAARAYSRSLNIMLTAKPLVFNGFITMSSQQIYEKSGFTG